MAGNAWLIVSDLHLYYKNLVGRKDYVGEMKHVMENIVRAGVRYRQAGYQKVNLLLLGDVFHRSYRSTFRTGYDNNFFVMWNQKFGECFSVIGNHELSYYESNPFFTLVSGVESQKVMGVSPKVWMPQGLLPIVRVVDFLEDGEVRFYFNHYGTSISVPGKGGVNIGLFHQEIVCNEIIKSMQESTGGSVWARTVDFSKLGVFDGYQYCFLGHMHKVYGVWQGDNRCFLYYLASLGRTNVGEVNDRMLERDIPAVLVEDGKFAGVESNKFSLAGEDECLDRCVVEENAHTYEIRKLREATKAYDIMGSDPVGNLRQYFADDAVTSVILDGLLSGDTDAVGLSLRERFRRRFMG